MNVFNIKGNTYYINTGMSYIPFYKINEHEIIMLDTGWATGERKIIDDFLDSNDYRVSGIISTHAHVDHIGNNQYLKDKFGCIIAMSEFEAEICCSFVGIKMSYANITLSSVENHFGSMLCETDIKIKKDENSVNICGIEFGIIHTPGHSPDHICIVTPDNVCYLGDALISHEVMKGAKMPYAYILKEDLKSKVSLKSLNYDYYVVAHYGVYENIQELIDTNIEFYKNRANGVYSVIKGYMTKQEILKACSDKFRIRTESIFKYQVIERMVKSYVEYLEETGALELHVVDGIAKYKRKDECNI